MTKPTLWLAAFASAGGVLIAILGGGLTEARAAEEAKKGTRALSASSLYLVPHIDRYRQEVWRWQTLMGKPRTRPAKFSPRDSISPAYRRWVLRLWQRRAQKTRRLALNPPRKEAWLCIHRHEGSWNDPNAPYYGGLQMDWSFMQAYGRELLRRKGTADNWTPVEQMWVAERAYRSGRGFYPWPRTARMCGLL